MWDVKRPPRIVSLAEVGLEDLPQVGGKNASLGELMRALSPEGVRVPEGFVVTAQAYREFLSDAELGPKIEALLEGLDAGDPDDLARRGRAAREAPGRAGDRQHLPQSGRPAEDHLGDRPSRGGRRGRTVAPEGLTEVRLWRSKSWTAWPRPCRAFRT